MTIPEIFKGKKLAKEFKPQVEAFKKITEEERRGQLKQMISKFNRVQMKALKHTLKIIKKNPKLTDEQKRDLDIYLELTGGKNK